MCLHRETSDKIFGGVERLPHKVQKLVDTLIYVDNNFGNIYDVEINVKVQK